MLRHHAVDDSSRSVLFSEGAPNEVADGLRARDGEIIETNALTWPSVSYAATEGRLLLFSSKTRHSVPPGDASSPRISISYDIVMTIRTGERKPSYEFLMPSPHTWRTFDLGAD
jgi:hypothetical protein